MRDSDSGTHLADSTVTGYNTLEEDRTRRLAGALPEIEESSEEERRKEDEP
jgi:hypothetical protein